jgi:hypothetical protein
LKPRFIQVEYSKRADGICSILINYHYEGDKTEDFEMKCIGYDTLGDKEAERATFTVDDNITEITMAFD